MLNLAICDNEPAIIEELEEYLDKISCPGRRSKSSASGGAF